MSIVKMQKVAILSHEEHQEQVLTALQEEGVLDISTESRVEGTEVDHTEVRARRADLEFAITTLLPLASKHTQRVLTKVPTYDEISQAASHTDVRGIVDELRKLEEDDTLLHRMISESEMLLEQLSVWEGLPLNLREERVSENSTLVFGSISSEGAEALLAQVQEELPRTAVFYQGSNQRSTVLSLALWSEDIEKFQLIAITHGWTEVSLPSHEGTPSVLCEEARAAVKLANQRIAKNIDKRSQLAIELPNLKKALTHLSWLDQKQDAREVLRHTDQTVTLMGWVPAKQIDHLRDILSDVSPATEILKVKPEEGEEPPVHLKNHPLIAPFQCVTSLYGLPLHTEKDPTGALSLFFILYFALCLTDAGYGLILALVFGTVVIKKKLAVDEAPLPWLLFFAGIVTFLVSIPFGGWFGLAPTDVPEFLTKQTETGLMFKGQIWQLTQKEGINFLMFLSIILGLTHLFFGMFLSGLHKWIHGNKMQAIWEDFTSHLLLGGCILHGVEQTEQTKWVLIATVVIFIWGKGYGSKWFLRPLTGLLGLVNFAIGMTSNTLSYLRILALGLVTGSIAGAVNQVAVALGNLFPTVVAIPTIILIFVGGHLVSIALNTLGSFIHSGRLQFIEFFSQFFAGGGRPFSPLSRKLT